MRDPKKNIPDQKKIDPSIGSKNNIGYIDWLFLVLDKDFSFDMEYLFFDPGTKEDQGRIEPKPKKTKKRTKKKLEKSWKNGTPNIIHFCQFMLSYALIA